MGGAPGIGEEGEQSVSLWGGLLRLGYRLWRHRIGPWSLGYWPLLIGTIWLIFAHRRETRPCALTLTVVGLILAGVMLIARRQGYLRFRRDESLAAHLPPDVAAIEPDEKVSIQASGPLEVRDNRRYFVAAEADFTTMETREHIVMARIPLSRMWLAARSPEEDEGWWYAFVRPAHIRSIQTGRLYHGLRPRPALKVVYQRCRLVAGKSQPKEVVTEETVYLSAAGLLTLHRLLEDLTRDAGQETGYGQYVPL